MVHEETGIKNTLKNFRIELRNRKKHLHTMLFK